MLYLRLALVMATALNGFAHAADLLQSRDVFDLELATDVQISPDGRQVAYVRRSMDIMTDRVRDNIWLISTDGKRHRPLLSGLDTYSSPRWSPSGDRIAYVSNAEGRGRQLHVRWMDTGEIALVSDLREAPQSVSWSPDGRHIAFAMFVPGEASTLAQPPTKPEGAKWAPAATIIDRLNYRVDGRGYLKAGNTHIFMLPAEGGTPRQLTEGNFEHRGPISWAPDGKRIAFSANRRTDYEYDPLESEIWTVDVRFGTLRQLTDRPGPDLAPAYSPDGKRIAYLGFDDRKRSYQLTEVYLMNADGSQPRAVTRDLDRSISDAQWAGRSDRLYIRFDDQGETHLASLTQQGRVERVAQNLGGTSLGRPYTSGTFSTSDNGTVAFTAGTSDRPAEVATVRRGRKVQTLTALNDDLLANKALGQVHTMTWTSSADGREIQGWMIKPPNFDAQQKYPLLLEIHGGPHTAYGPHFSAELQLYAAAGYLVLYANPRGSTSYGEEFASLIHHNYPGQDYDDLMSGVDAAIATGHVDPERLFVTGGSGGGILTAWIVGKTDRFRAAVSAKPVINWVSTTLTSDISAFMTQYWFATLPWEDPDAYWARSPLSLVGNVSTPTMLLTGEQDHRTPIPEAEQYYQALKLRKIDTLLVRIPEASHGISARPSHLIAKVDNILAWFARYR